MTDTYVAPRGGLNFGDICEAEFLYDIHVRADARSLVREEAPASFARKRWNIDAAVPYYVALEEVPSDQNFALAHGWHRQAICLSDDCLIATVLGDRQDRSEAQGRLLFAPVVPARDDDLQALEERPTYGRFPLPGDGHHSEHAIVELRRCFMVDSRDVASVLEPFVIRSLEDHVRTALAVRWAAYACRRGPFVVEDNMEKFADFLFESGVDEAQATSVATALANVAAAAWALEGGGLEVAGSVKVDGSPADEVVERIREQLGRLGNFAAEAASAVESLTI